MIGLRAGLAAGVRAAFVTNPILPLIFGGPSDSNGVGQDVGPDEWDETFDPMTAITSAMSPPTTIFESACTAKKDGARDLTRTGRLLPSEMM